MPKMAVMETTFSNIPSPFDNLPEDHPVVFISYSWDSDEHKAWVRKLSDDLREKHSVHTLLDQYNRGGYDLISFMTQAVEKADRVLMIGTPEYKRKSELYDGGGVKYEDQLITIELYHKMGTSKFVPVLRAGKFDTSFRSLIETRTGYDMRDDSCYEEILNQLAADLWNTPVNAAPALGPKPTYVTRSKGLNTSKVEVAELTSEQFVVEIKRLLSTPNSEITFTEMIEGETQKAYEQILSIAHYNFSITQERFNYYLTSHLKAVEKLVVASTTIVRYGTQKQQELLVDAMVKLCMKPFVNNEFSEVGTSNLHLFAATFLFHSVGISCVKYGYYQILPLMMKRMVPEGHALSPSYPYPLAHLAGTCHWQADVLNIYMDTNWLYPYSELLSRNLKPYFESCFLNDDEYKNCFAIWEHLFSLMYVYYENAHLRNVEVFPVGLFLSERILRYNMKGGKDTYNRFFAESGREKDNWEPLKQGLFDGKYASYKEVYDRGEEFYKHNRRY